MCAAGERDGPSGRRHVRGRAPQTAGNASGKRGKAAPRVKAYRCNTCGNRYTEKTKLGHAKMFGHSTFTKVK